MNRKPINTTYNRLKIIQHKQPITAARLATLAGIKHKVAQHWLKSWAKRGILVQAGPLFYLSQEVRL